MDPPKRRMIISGFLIITSCKSAVLGLHCHCWDYEFLLLAKLDESQILQGLMNRRKSWVSEAHSQRALALP